MQLFDDGLGIVCGVIVLVLLLNISILLPIIRRGFANPKNPLKEFQSPWHKEQEAINELRSTLLDLEIAIDEEKTTHDAK
jgi:hypothetical protein